jgi:hypothetical protein
MAERPPDGPQDFTLKPSEEPPDAADGSLTEAPAGGGRPRWWQDIRVIGGLTAVGLGLGVVLIVAVLSISFIHDDAAQVATVASSAFTVVGTLVGAYFGIKVGTDQTKAAMDQTQQAMEQVERTTQTMREEAAKAQAFSLWVPPDSAGQAMEDARAFAFSRRETGPSETTT